MHYQMNPYGAVPNLRDDIGVSPYNGQQYPSALIYTFPNQPAPPTKPYASPPYTPMDTDYLYPNYHDPHTRPYIRPFTRPQYTPWDTDYWYPPDYTKPTERPNTKPIADPPNPPAPPQTSGSTTQPQTSGSQTTSSSGGGTASPGQSIDFGNMFSNSNNFLANLMSLLGNATTSEQVQIGDMASSKTGTLPELANTIRNLYATYISRELGLDQNAASRYASDQTLAAQKYAADKRFEEAIAANQNRLDVLAKEQERQRQREGLFQQMAAGIGAPVFRGTNWLMNSGSVPFFTVHA
jgi:hypothetical protein